MYLRHLFIFSFHNCTEFSRSNLNYRNPWTRQVYFYFYSVQRPTYFSSLLMKDILSIIKNNQQCVKTSKRRTMRFHVSLYEDHWRRSQWHGCFVVNFVSISEHDTGKNTPVVQHFFFDTQGRLEAKNQDYKLLRIY